MVSWEEKGFLLEGNISRQGGPTNERKNDWTNELMNEWNAWHASLVSRIYWTSSRPVCSCYFLSDSPRIICYTTGAQIGDRNVRLQCDIASRPRYTSVAWIVDSNGTVVREKESVLDHWTIVTVGTRTTVHIPSYEYSTCTSWLHVIGTSAMQLVNIQHIRDSFV